MRIRPFDPSRKASPPEILKKEVRKIFQKFYRTQRAEQSGEAGTGIGLSIVEQIVLQHGGKIEVTSAPGEGFLFYPDITDGDMPWWPNRWRPTEMQRLLVVEDDAGVRATIVNFLELEGYAVDAVASSDEALERLNQNAYPIIISDIYIDSRTGLDVLEAARRKDPDCSVILMTARGTMETVMAATRGGAFDYIAKPFELDRMLETVKRAEAVRDQECDEVEPEELPETDMIGSSAAMVEIYKTVSRVAPTDATVLIEGETGTGKELVARMIHCIFLPRGTFA